MEIWAEQSSWAPQVKTVVYWGAGDAASITVRAFPELPCASRTGVLQSSWDTTE